MLIFCQAAGTQNQKTPLAEVSNPDLHNLYTYHAAAKLPNANTLPEPLGEACGF